MVTGTLCFGIPDESVRGEDLSFFSTPQNKEIVAQEVELHDFRKSTDIVQGPDGLDVQGFTWLKHRSKIIESGQVLEGRNAEEVYLPELEELMLKVTGARSVVVWNGLARQKLPNHQDGASMEKYKRGSEEDQIFDKQPRDEPIMSGKHADMSVEPVRAVHIDMNNTGLRATARHCRHDIRKAARRALEAEDAGEEAPRYAAYSIWRPLQTIVRDPLAACDWRTVDQEHDLYDTKFRNPSDNEQGEFLNTIRTILPPKVPVQQKWYYYPGQTTEDVLILKIGDTGSDKDPSIACGAPHASPRIKEMTGVKEPRCSIEVRIIAFW